MAKKTTSKSSGKVAPKKAAKSVKTVKSEKKSSTKTKTDTSVSLSKIAKAKVKTKVKEKPQFQPRKIEKIIDVARLEKKLEEILSSNHKEHTVEEKLKAIYMLQEVDSNIDKIRTIRGELPMEVADLEDELAGLNTRVEHIRAEIDSLNDLIAKKKVAMKESKDRIKKYESQQDKVKNNREFDSLNKEIEFQNLEIQLAEKRSKEHAADIITKQALLEETEAVVAEKQAVLNLKKSELETIIEETRKEEDALKSISSKTATIVDERLLSAYRRLRDNTRNGLAVVSVQRDSCGGCFNKIPPQRQLDIRQHKKVIVCEHCGRILVDARIDEDVLAENS
ncbi:MAG: zinc ribbon domain-containing protein [Bacteroidota bacterium]